MSQNSQKKLTPDENLPGISYIKKCMTKTDRSTLDRILKQNSSCLMFEDNVPITVKVENVRVERKDKNGKAQIYVTAVDIETGKELYDISAEELVHAADAAWNAGYFEVDRYLGIVKLDGNTKVRVRWTTGEETREPLKQVKEDDPVGLALFVKDQGLQDHKKFEWINNVLRTAATGEAEEEKSKESGPREYLQTKCINGSYSMLVKYKSGEEVDIPLQKLKEEDPLGLALWAKSSGLLNHENFSWANNVLEKEDKLNSSLTPKNNEEKKSAIHMDDSEDDIDESNEIEEVEEYLSIRTLRNIYVLEVRWTGGKVTLEPLTKMKRADPVRLARWAIGKGLDGHSRFNWIKSVKFPDESRTKHRPHSMKSGNGFNRNGEESSKSTSSRRPIEYLETKSFNGTCKIRTKLSSGKIEWIMLTRLRIIDPVGVSKFAKKKKLLSNIKFKWCKKFLKKKRQEGSEESETDSEANSYSTSQFSKENVTNDLSKGLKMINPGGKWQAQLPFKGRKFTIGLFGSRSQALQAINIANGLVSSNSNISDVNFACEAARGAMLDNSTTDNSATDQNYSALEELPKPNTNLDLSSPQQNASMNSADEFLQRRITTCDSGKFQAEIFFNGHSRYVGEFDTRTAATAACELKRKELLELKQHDNFSKSAIDKKRKMKDDQLMSNKKLNDDQSQFRYVWV